MKDAVLCLLWVNGWIAELIYIYRVSPDALSSNVWIALFLWSGMMLANILTP